jgi:undecaprenyl-diphosphatase
MNAVSAVILSLIEGMTEFLPISSTGHLILASKLLGIAETEFTKSFEIFIQLGAIMAVVSLYITKIVRKPKIIKPILIAFLPTGILGFMFYKFIKTYLFTSDQVVVFSLALVGALLIALERYWHSHPPKGTKAFLNLPPQKLLAIGLLQSLSMVPGVSRAAATIVGGMLVGLSRQEAVEFSFLLAVPTMAAATGYDLLKSSSSFSSGEWGVLALGFVVSWISAIFVIKAFIRYISRATFTGFGIYRIAIAMLYWIVSI